ncbi:DUF6090 family protein [Robiginitalea sp. M366]|uniref:DUF6090 family protein n=1 Tax=Robiginitalea aestuariiviva TaxID=3036903 RepID=UPI00240E46A0|nr:DUF6090 family protein [Robiginitalea aestuariiviva]MDG1572137.1 DUF6090 family protein [Robiginitalea aestuariiviva]
MLTLLRSLRRGLLQEKKFGPYLLYALGEILLIIVGILAALWIDGWNQQRQENQREQFYLQGLREEFQLSLVKLDTLIAVNRKSYETCMALVQQIPEARSREDEAALSRMLIPALSNEIAYNPNNSLLKEIISSGGLEILSNPELRQHLTSWESFLQSVNRQEQNLRNIRERTMDVMLGPQGSILILMRDAGMAHGFTDPGRPGREHSNLPLLQSLEFENKLLVYLVTAESTERLHYQPLRRKILSILEQIESEHSGRR